LLLAFALLPAWAWADSAKPEPAAKPETAIPALPTARAVLERYAKAIGGGEAFAKCQSQRAVGTVEMAAQGMKGQVEIFSQRPAKLLMRISLAGIGDMDTVYDGKVGWMTTALTGPMLLEGPMLSQIAEQADFDKALRDPEDYKSLELVGIEPFAGEECYKLKLEHKSGLASTEYFSVKTGLQRGLTSTQDSPLGKITATSILSDYQQFGDLFIPSKVSQKGMGIQTVMTFTAMEFNNVDPAVFEMPDAVKALLDRPKLSGEKEPAPLQKQPAGPEAKPAQSKN